MEIYKDSDGEFYFTGIDFYSISGAKAQKYFVFQNKDLDGKINKKLFSEKPETKKADT
jgi:hypothetical protein